jgi:hypothetical protein
VEFEDTPALGRCHRIAEINTINDADELDTEWNASRERTKDVAEVLNALRRVQLGHSDFFCPASRRDGRAASRAQVTHPLGLAPGGPDPTPASDRNDRQRRGARQATLPAANGDELIEAQRYASIYQELQDWAEDPNPPWDTSTRRHCDIPNLITHVLVSFLRRFVCGATQKTRKKARM